MNNENIKAWVTRYALTTGVELVDAEVCHDINSRMISYNNEHGLQHAHGDDWHRTRKAALAQADKMRKARIASLRKSIAKLEAMTFTISE